MNDYIFTPKGYEILLKLIERIESGIERATETKAQAGTGQDDWHDEQFQRAMIEEEIWGKRLTEIRNIQSRARIVQPQEQNEEIKIGNGVEIKYEDTEETFKFVMDGYLINFSDDNRVSIYSPLGSALIGAKKGEKRTIEIRGTIKNVIVLEIILPSKVEKIIEKTEE